MANFISINKNYYQYRSKNYCLFLTVLQLAQQYMNNP